MMEENGHSKKRMTIDEAIGKLAEEYSNMTREELIAKLLPGYRTGENRLLVNLDDVIDLCMEMKLIDNHTNYAVAYEKIAEALTLDAEEFLCRYTKGLVQMIQVGTSERGVYKGFGSQTAAGVKMLLKVEAQLSSFVPPWYL